MLAALVTSAVRRISLLLKSSTQSWSVSVMVIRVMPIPKGLGRSLIKLWYSGEEGFLIMPPGVKTYSRQRPEPVPGNK